MNPHRLLPSFATVILLTAPLACAQNIHGPATISATATNVHISWTGTGTLQSSPDVSGAWWDELEATSPFAVALISTQGFYRVISRWSTRADLIEANSEMGVAELDGKIYVMGGYPANRVTVDTVQVYDSTSNNWRLTTPLLVGVNHPMPAVANEKVPDHTFEPTAADQ